MRNGSGESFWWLASYPKSGNTWLRSMVMALVTRSAVDINRLARFGVRATSRPAFDQTLGIRSADLSDRQIMDLRPRFYEAWTTSPTRPLYCKVHDAYIRTSTGEPLFPARVTAGAIYVVRDPRAVAVAYAHHTSLSIDHVIRIMGSPRAGHASRADRLRPQLPEHLGRWDDHVRGWLAAPFPVMRLRYEDMLADPRRAVTAIAARLGCPCDRADIERIVNDTSLSVFQAQEAAHGFHSKPLAAAAFFREGAADGWRRDLTAVQIAEIEATHRDVMREHGYL